MNSIITSHNNLIDTSSRPQSKKDKLRWNQLKIDKVWTAYFNTDAANTAAVGQNYLCIL